MNKLELMAAKLAHSTNFVESEFDETFCKGVTCKFLADSQINMPPSNFIEAVETFKSLNASPPTGIIKSAHLYPVNKLGVSKTVVAVGSDVVEEVEGLISGYNKVQNELPTLLLATPMSGPTRTFNFSNTCFKPSSARLASLCRILCHKFESRSSIGSSCHFSSKSIASQVFHPKTFVCASKQFLQLQIF